MKNFNAITFEIIDITINAAPDLYINPTGITFSKKVLEELSYPANVQYCVSPEKVFAIRACKSNETKPVPFSKPKNEQKATLSTSNKTLMKALRTIMPEHYNPKQRYKVTGHYDADSRTMFFDLDEIIIDQSKSK